MKRIIPLILVFLLIACSSPEPEPQPAIEPTPTTPEPAPVMDCSKFFIEVTACRDDHTVKYTVTGNAPFSYQFVGLGATPFQDDFREIKTTHTGSIQTAQRLSAIVINPSLNGVMCKESSQQIDLEDC